METKTVNSVFLRLTNGYIADIIWIAIGRGAEDDSRRAEKKKERTGADE